VIDLISGNNQDVLGSAVFNRVEILEDRICCAAVSFTATRRQTHHGLAVIPPKLITKLSPAISDVRMQPFMLVLSKQVNAPKSRIERIREREVENPEHAPEWNCWFWLIGRERIKAFALTSCEDEGQGFVFKKSLWIHTSIPQSR
jgi:hypothetical protein